MVVFMDFIWLMINGNFRILNWRYVSTICLAIFSGDIPLHSPYIGLFLGINMDTNGIIIGIYMDLYGLIWINIPVVNNDHLVLKEIWFG